MPDVFGVYDDMKVWEYLDFFARCYGIPGPRRRRMIGDLLDLVDLGDKRDAYVQGLSRGMQQRLCLAHTLVHDPEVLLLDEPASGLDPRARVELRELLRELRALGKTIVISSHILPELEELCTAVAIVDHGQVLAHGKVSDIERRLRFGAVLRVRILTGHSLEAARDHFARRPARRLRDDPRRRPDRARASAATTRPRRSSWPRPSAAGIRITSFARAASDLEELFLQVTAAGRPAAAGGLTMTDERRDADRRRCRSPATRSRTRRSTPARRARSGPRRSAAGRPAPDARGRTRSGRSGPASRGSSRSA